ncbi:MAG: MFS transporter [Solirubrobacteraceae bacterium MAG38_C4-C5]|nr:MFS transporter [Candidatus Siliceabacter maunaloa]
MLSPLAHATYRRLFAAQVVALIGTGLTTVALTLLAYDLAGDNAGAVIGIALALKMVAYVVVSPIITSFAHRLPRRPLLVSLDLLRAGVVLLMPFVDQVWQVYVLIFVLNACSAGFTPTFQATIPDILEDEQSYTRALSLSRLAYELENLLSPALAALALAVISYDGLFVANGAGFLISALLVISVTLPHAAASERTGGPLAKLTFGTRAYLATPRLRGLLALNLAVAAASAMIIVNTVVYVRDLFGRGGSEVAVAFGASGAGAMIAALALPAVLDRVNDRPVMLTGGGLIGAGLALGALTPSFGALLAVWFVLGVGLSLVQTPAGRLLQRSAGSTDRPALFAAQFSLSHACWLVTYPFAGLVGVALGLPVTSALLGAVAAVALLVATRAWPAHEADVMEHTHEPHEHDHTHVHDDHHRHDHPPGEAAGAHAHSHPHRHPHQVHAHTVHIDLHHPRWPTTRTRRARGK